MNILSFSKDVASIIFQYNEAVDVVSFVRTSKRVLSSRDLVDAALKGKEEKISSYLSRKKDRMISCFTGLLSRKEVCQAVEHLDVSGSMFITNEIVASLFQKLPLLKRLDLSFCNSLTDDCLPLIAGLSCLQELSLWHNSQISSISDQYLTQLKRVRKLKVCAKMLTETGMGILGESSELRSLSLSSCEGISDKAMQALSKSKSIEQLFLEGCQRGFSHLVSMPLKQLTLYACHIQNDELLALASLGLHKISLYRCQKISLEAKEQLRCLSPGIEIEG
jgi:hypothetical protein